MPRIARVVAPGVPHHVTQRGNRRLQTFFKEEDYRAYIKMMASCCRQFAVEIWSYCLMPNHVHLIAVPAREDSLRRAIGEAHRLYTSMINQRYDWRGHLWQGRFYSLPLDERYLLAAARYVEMNPVRAGLAAQPENYSWSSAGAHLSGQDDGLVRTEPLLSLAGDWRKFLAHPLREETAAALRSHESTGRPLGDEEFIESLESATGRVLKHKLPGPRTGVPVR